MARTVTANDKPATEPTAESIRRFNRFALKMRKEIEGNAAKGDWTRYTEEEARKELEQHITKMDKARAAGDRVAYFEHLGDVANCTMFLANAAGFLEPGSVVTAGTWSCYDDYWGQR